MALPWFRKRLSGEGFTLLEIMIALFILAIVILGMLQMHLGLVRQRINDRKRTQAISLASMRLEQIRGTTFTSITQSNFPDETPVAGMPEFRRYTRITNVGGGTTTRSADVVVYWSTVGGTFTLRNSLTIGTVIAR